MNTPKSEAPRQWDIVVVPFPYAAQLAENGFLWVLMITTSCETWHGDVAIEDYKSVGLPAPSKVRTAKIATIEAGRVLRVTGRFSATPSQKISQAITSNLSG